MNFESFYCCRVLRVRCCPRNWANCRWMPVSPEFVQVVQHHQENHLPIPQRVLELREFLLSSLVRVFPHQEPAKFKQQIQNQKTKYLKKFLYLDEVKIPHSNDTVS